MRNFIKPKGIKGQDKLNRIKDLMGKIDPLTESKTLSELEVIKKGPNDIVYGIIRENQNYFIKTTTKTEGEVKAEDFDYVGGLQNKNEERYNSYNDAVKQLNLKFDMLNESFGVKEDNRIFEADGVAFGGGAGFGFVLEKDAPPEEVNYEGEEETLIADQKKVIKVDAPAQPAADIPVEDEVEIDMGADIADVDMEDEEVEVDIEEDGDEVTKKIQKLTGKIGQLLRDLDEPDPELDKYVINSIISAVDWENMSDEDVEEIIAKIEGDDEEESDEMEDVEMDVEIEEPAEEEIAEGEEKEGEEEEKEGGEKEDEGDEDVDDEDKEEKKKHYEGAIKDLEDKIASLKKDMGYDKKKEEEVSESNTYSKKELMENFLKKNANIALKKVLTESEAICEECLGKGCGSCVEEGWAPLSEDAGEVEQQIQLAGDDVGVVEQEMSVVDAIATGQDYLYATGDLDRDGDDIPNRLDVDNNADGELDHFMGNNPAPAEPTTKPGTKPTTRPGKGKPRWKKIPRPGVNPKPKALKERKKTSIKRSGIYK